MTVSPLDSRIFADLLGDAEVGALFSDEATVAALVAAERALARAGARHGVIPAAAGAELDAALAAVAVAPEALTAGTAAAGVPVPALLAALRERLPAEAGHWLHWGTTSQDIVDSALALRLGQALDRLGIRLDRLVALLRTAAYRWADLPMAGRTRSRVAAPVTFGLRCANWAGPLIEHGRALALLRPLVARAQLGGAVGTLGVFGPAGPAVAATFAGELGLVAAPPWHTDRCGVAALAAWCAGVSGATAKMAGDLILMGRSESGEAASGTGGGSSTMPQKENPVAAETVVALARAVAAFAAPLQGAVHAEERDGAAWTLEWLLLPQAVTATAAALRLATGLADSLAPDPDRLAAVLAGDHGAAQAEQASFLLARHMPRAEATALVRDALAEARAEGSTLAVVLARHAPALADWPAALAPDLAAARARIDAIFADRPA
jgi:3-carboxy-cis,cis-muconate cycloisomerase